MFINYLFQLQPPNLKMLPFPITYVPVSLLFVAEINPYSYLNYKIINIQLLTVDPAPNVSLFVSWYQQVAAHDQLSVCIERRQTAELECLRMCILRQMAKLEKRCIRGYHCYQSIWIATIQESSFLVYCIASFHMENFILLINSYNKNFREKNFRGLALSTNIFNSELFPNYSIYNLVKCIYVHARILCKYVAQKVI